MELQTSKGMECYVMAHVNLDLISVTRERDRGLHKVDGVYGSKATHAMKVKNHPPLTKQGARLYSDVAFSELPLQFAHSSWRQQGCPAVIIISYPLQKE